MYDYRPLTKLAYPANIKKHAKSIQRMPDFCLNKKLFWHFSLLKNISFTNRMTFQNGLHMAFQICLDLAYYDVDQF